MKMTIAYDILVLRFSDRYFFVLADHVSVIEQSLSQARTSFSSLEEMDGAAKVDLNTFLNIREDEQSSSSQKHIVVQMAEGVIVYKTNASLIISRLAVEDFYQLPSVIRESGCAKWVRGTALLESQNANETEEPTVIAIWIDLRILGKELSLQGSTKVLST